jgi:hypothetical protein
MQGESFLFAPTFDFNSSKKNSILSLKIFISIDILRAAKIQKLVVFSDSHTKPAHPQQTVKTPTIEIKIELMFVSTNCV